MAMHSALDAATRVAMAAYLHDLGKFAERAGVFADHPALDAHLQTYCPFHRDGGWFSHRHAAHTALAIDALEPYLPLLVGSDNLPFSPRVRAAEGLQPDATDSLINAAAMHHKPETTLQWIVATADRVASGFEREEFERYNLAAEGTATGRNHYQARQLTLFEQIALEGEVPRRCHEFLWRYPLKPLSAEAIFPVAAQGYEPDRDSQAQDEYHTLWDSFVAALPAIPASHRDNLALWLDHFDSLWLTYTHAIPAATAFGVRPEVSLYDHSHTTAALATALWCWHEEHDQLGSTAAEALRSRADWDEDKLLLIQGDFFGIQDFIFTEGGETNRSAAKLLRGRSFQVSLFTELAALKVLETLQLPPTSQVINAAGKLLIVAANTPATLERLMQVRRELDAWFLRHTFGQAGLGLAWTQASCNDFISKGVHAGFASLLQRLFAELTDAKLRRFDLCGQGQAGALDASFPYGVCKYNGRLPADQLAEDGRGSCALSRDQIAIGRALVGMDRLLVVDEKQANCLNVNGSLKLLETPLFGYRVAFTRREELNGRFGLLAGSGALRRCWDYSLPTSMNDVLFNGYARRQISGYVPRFSAGDEWTAKRYGPVGDIDFDHETTKTLNHLACEDRIAPDADGRYCGVVALTTLKGDIDELGAIFQKGLPKPSFAHMAALSRQVNAFFSVYLPVLLAKHYPNTYTVFAGGDDFFLIGPWLSTQHLAKDLADAFARYVTGNPEVHFSAGMFTHKPGIPVHAMAAGAEAALAEAKARPEKNAATIYGICVPWSCWGKLQAAEARLGELRDAYALSTSYVYGLLQLVDMATGKRPEDALWRARFAYRTRRFVVDRLKEGGDVQRQSAQTQLLEDIGERGINPQTGLGQAYRLVLFNHLYQRRER